MNFVQIYKVLRLRFGNGGALDPTGKNTLRTWKKAGSLMHNRTQRASEGLTSLNCLALFRVNCDVMGACGDGTRG